MSNQEESPSSRSLHVVVVGGGTGGHLFPGVAVAEALQTLEPTLVVSFVGMPDKIEGRVIPKLGYPFYPLEVRPLKSGGVAGTLKGLSFLPKAGFRANVLLNELRPDFVLAVGGYVAGPFAALAALKGVPTALMEQNAPLGLTNSLLSRVVWHAFLSFEKTAESLPNRCTYSVTGNPVRRDFLQQGAPFTYQAPTPNEPIHLLVLGGSGGASSLNRFVPQRLAALPEELRKRLRITHQAGNTRLEEATSAYEGLDLNVTVVPFIDEMINAYMNAHLVICRAGMSTIAELTLLGLPSLLVPFPSKDAHQSHNAEELAEAGAAIWIPNDALPEPSTTSTIEDLLSSASERLTLMSRNAKALGRPHAADEVAKTIYEKVKR